MPSQRGLGWKTLSPQDLQLAFDRSRGFENLPFPQTEIAVENSDEVERVIRKLEFATLAATGELGEFAGILKRRARDAAGGKPGAPPFKDLAAELGDLFCYVLKLGKCAAVRPPTGAS
jgi:hypothetical protein